MMWLMFSWATLSGGDRAGGTANASTEINHMNPSLTRWPHCGVKPGNFRYADAIPHGHEELKHNTRQPVPAPKPALTRAKSWPVGLFTRVLRLAEN
jgi:hypothetical protein